MSMHMAGAVVWGAVGALCIFRGVFRAHRAVVAKGAVQKCAGEMNQFGICDPSDMIDTEPGEAVYATAPSKVVEVGEYYVHLLAQNETVILMYEGLEPSVREGQHVGTGQKIGSSDGRLFFSVTQYKPDGVAQFVPPSAWLAVRGMKLASKDTGAGTAYCAQGRDIIVPNANKRNCSLVAPTKAGFALLPVSVEME